MKSSYELKIEAKRDREIMFENKILDSMVHGLKTTVFTKEEIGEIKDSLPNFTNYGYKIIDENAYFVVIGWD